jgi:hypothetical protein
VIGKFGKAAQNEIGFDAMRHFEQSGQTFCAAAAQHQFRLRP